MVSSIKRWYTFSCEFRKFDWIISNETISLLLACKIDEKVNRSLATLFENSFKMDKKVGGVGEALNLETFNLFNRRSTSRIRILELATDHLKRGVCILYIIRSFHSSASRWIFVFLFLSVRPSVPLSPSRNNRLKQDSRFNASCVLILCIHTCLF